MSLNISAFTQLQNWSAGQAAVNKQIFGNPDAAPTTDFSIAFANAETNFATQQNSLAVTAMQLRQVQKAQSAAKPASSTAAKDKSGSGATATTKPPAGTTATAKPAAGKAAVDPALTAAKAAGKDILTVLGLISSPPTKTKPSSSSGPYVPPTNPATGHAYVATSAASVGDLGALNVLA